jgi:radical SAM superfamily enzyme YgiQ (UPF0313 family)
MRFQLFVPPQGYVAQRWEEGGSMPPLGILYLAAVLEKKGVEVDVVPCDVLQLSWHGVEKRIRDFCPDIVGATTTTENRFESFRLARIAKKIDPGIMTVLGGPHVSMAEEDTLLHVQDVDVAVVGEAENTVVELADAVESGHGLENVKGLFIRRNGSIEFTGTRDRIQDLDSLPFPARHLIPMDAYNFYVKTPDGERLKAQNIMTSRGCPFDCYFCATPVNWGRRMREYSPERVLAEMEHLIETYDAKYIWFYDDTFNYNPKRVHKIMDMILERKLDIKFCNEFRIDVLDKQLLEKMVRAGLVWGHFGIEAGNLRVRSDVVRKSFDIERAYQFVRWAKELDFVPHAFLIFSHHTETWKEAHETIEIMDTLKSINPRTEISSAILHIYPGTPLEKIAKEKNIIPPDFSWSKKKDMRNVYVLPAAQGYVPLFKDKLKWLQIADLVMRWSARNKKIVSGAKFRAALITLTSFRAVPVYFAFFLTLMKYKLKSFFQKAS